MTQQPEEMVKVTMQLPKALLDSIRQPSGKSLTAIVRQALLEYKANLAYAGWMQYRGKIDLDVDIEDSRRDKN